MFDRAREREGAYDFLESEHVDAAAVAESMFEATASRAKTLGTVFVALDISSLTLTDNLEAKDIGVIGASNRPARGVLMVNALAIDARGGVPLGLIDQQYWIRPERRKGTIPEKVKENLYRPFQTKQGAWFLRAAQKSVQRLAAVDVVPWFAIDREGDAREILQVLSQLPCLFTIRGTQNRRLSTNEEEAYVRAALLKSAPIGEQIVEIARHGGRAARTARVEVRAKDVELHFHQKGWKKRESHRVHAVWVRELDAPKGLEPLDWMLYTNAPVTTPEAAFQVVDSYRARWRVEEFHRTWKKGECEIETTQLRSLSAVLKWATVLAAVATRIERIKYLARTSPETPASVEFSPIEIDAMKLEREMRAEGKRPPKLPDVPSIRQATEWIAEMGGWMGRRSSGPPGSLTLARGLDRLSIYVSAIAAVEAKNSRKPAARRRR